MTPPRPLLAPLSGALLILLLAVPVGPAYGQSGSGSNARSNADSLRGAGPPPPLAGVPIDFRCEAALGSAHALLNRQPGEDLRELARADDFEGDLGEWLDRHMCQLIWQRFERAGAHAMPNDVELPARAVLSARLISADLEGTRMVEQRVGSTIMPVSVPHWALSLRWWVRFHIEYPSGTRDAVEAPALELKPLGGAEQEDYTPLRLGALLIAAVHGSFGDMPQIVADEGRLGDLLFTVVDRPGEAPAQLGADDAINEEFWQLLVPVARRRHDALAFFLSSDRLPPEGRRQLATWFVLNDSDHGLRRDALAWLFRQEPPVDSGKPISKELTGLLEWLLRRDLSPRLRSEVMHNLVGRTGDGVRDLVLIGTTDADPRVSDVAISALRKFAPATAGELTELQDRAVAPSLASWTTALDGRVEPPDVNPDRDLLRLALATGGWAAETWTVGWLQLGTVVDSDLEWVVPAWRQLAADPSIRLRGAALKRLGAEARTRLDAEAILIDRIAAETDPALRVTAINALDRGDAKGAADALILASRSNNAKVRAAAANALATVPDRDAGSRLETLMRNDSDGKVRRRAKRALRQRERSAVGG